MEELATLKKQTKILKSIFLIILLINIIFLAIIFIGIKNSPTSVPPPQLNAEKQFNIYFERYIGKQRGNAIKLLIIDIKTSNTNTKEHQIQTVGITQISEILDNEYYNVKMEYSNSGYINKIIIENSED